MIKKIWSLLIITSAAYLMGCENKLSEKSRNEITDKIEPTSFSKYCDYVEISEAGKEVKGDFFTSQKFTVRVYVKNNCFANLAEGFAVDKVKFCNEAELNSYKNKESLVLEEYKKNDTITITGILFSSEIETNKEFIREERNCLYYLMPKKTSVIQNESESCNILNSYFNYGLGYIKIMNEKKYDEIMISNNKDNLKEADRKAILLIGYSTVKMKIYDLFYEKKELDLNGYLTALFNSSINMFYVAEPQDLNCKFTILKPNKN